MISLFFVETKSCKLTDLPKLAGLAGTWTRTGVGMFYMALPTGSYSGMLGARPRQHPLCP